MSADKVAAGANALVDKAIQQHYKNNLKSWFLRYGYLKAIDGVVTTYPKIKLLHVQDLIFTHHDECLAAKRPCLQMTLKPRKGGASTGHQAAMYFRGRKFPGREGAVMGDIFGTSTTVFEIYRRFAENDGFDWGDGFGNLRPDDKEHNLTDDIVLPNGSTYKKVTAGSSNANRSGTIQFANGTEVSYYPNNLERDPLTSFLGSWHDHGEASYACLDSTSNGPQGKFYEMYMDERNGWKKIFSAWFQEPTYRIPFRNTDEENKLRREVQSEKEDMDTMQRFNLDWEQMHWIRDKLLNKCGGSRDKLNKEYPNTVEEAFLSKSALRFNIHVLENMENLAKSHPPKKGDFVTQDDGGVSFIPDPQGDVKIFEEPVVGRRYLGIFDPCAGEDQQAKGQSANPDWHSVGILRESFIDVRNGQHFPPMVAAHYHSRADVAVATETAAAMSRHYGKCQFVVETNGVGLYPVKTLAALNIPLWARKVKGKTPGQMDAQDGWFSNEQLRTTIIDTLGSYIQKWKLEEPSFDCWDLDIIAELKKMVTKDGRDEAMAGAHDDCLVAGTLVRCRRGMVPIEDVGTEDEVLTHLGRYRRVTRTIARKSFEVFEIRSTGKQSIRVTPNHPLLVARRSISWNNYTKSGGFLIHEEPQWLSVNTGGLEGGAALGAIPTETQDVHEIDLLPYCPPTYKEVGGRLKAFTYGGTRVNSKQNLIPRMIPVDDKFCFLLGYFAAEGSSGVHSVHWASHARELPVRDYVCEYLRSLGLRPWSKSTSENGWAVSIGSVPMSNFFRQFGTGKRKKFPEWVSALPIHKQKHVLMGYMLGDGSFSTGGLISASISPTLAFQIHEMISRQGLRATIRFRHQYGVTNGCWITQLGQYDATVFWNWLSDGFKAAKLRKLRYEAKVDSSRLRFTGNYLAGRIEGITPIRGEVETYCIDVDEDHSFHANGIVVHNCVMMLAMGLYLRANATLLLEARPPKVNFEKLLKQQGWKLIPNATSGF